MSNSFKSVEKNPDATHEKEKNDSFLPVSDVGGFKPRGKELPGLLKCGIGLAGSSTLPLLI